MRSQRGFSLIELLVVIGISVIVISVGLAWLDTERKRTARGEAITTQAIEMATLGRALDQYLRGSPPLPGDGSPRVISFDDLRAAALVPSNYAVRDQNGSAPTSPLGQAYTLVARLQDGNARGLVLATGAPSPAAMARVGLKQTDDGLADYQSTVTRQMRTQQYVASAFIGTGTTAANRLVSTFDFDFAPFVGTPVAAATAVAMVGFPEFSAAPDIKVTIDPDSFPGPGGGGGGGGGDGSGNNRFCYLAEDQSCPTAYDTVFQYEMCSRWSKAHQEAGEPSNATVRTAAGDLRVKRETRETVTNLGGSSAVRGLPPPSFKSNDVYRASTDYWWFDEWVTYWYYDRTCTATSGQLSGRSFTYEVWEDSQGNYSFPSCQEAVLVFPGTSNMTTPETLRALSNPHPGVLFADNATLGMYGSAQALTGGYRSELVTEAPVASCMASSPYAIPTPFWSRPGQYRSTPSTVVSATVAVPSLQPLIQPSSWVMATTKRMWLETLEYQGTQYASTLCEEELLATGTSATLFSTLPAADRRTVNLCPEPGETQRTQALFGRPDVPRRKVSVCCSKN